MTAPVLPPAPRDVRPCAASPSIAPQVSRYRMRSDRPGLSLRAGEIVLCAPYAPAERNMLVLVRCEVDGHGPGALLSVNEVEHLGLTGETLGPCSWGKPGVRP